MFFKLGIYILIAALMYGTLCTGGLVLQGAYMGVFTDSSVGQTTYDRLVTDYSRTTNGSLTVELEDYVQRLEQNVTNVNSSDQLYNADVNGDGVLDAADVMAAFKTDEALAAIKTADVYESMKTRMDIGYKATLTCLHTSDQTPDPITVTTGNEKLVKDSLIDSGYDDIYDNGTTVDIPVYKYIVFDNEDELKKAEQIVDSYLFGTEDTDVYYDDYTTDGYTEATTEESAADILGEDYQDMLYNGNYPSRRDSVYLEIGGGYCMLLGYDTGTYIDINARTSVDKDKVVQYIKADDADIESNLAIWSENAVSIMVMFIAAGLLCIILTIVSIINAGVKTGNKEIRLSRAERVPTELTVALIVGAVAAAMGIVIEGGLDSKCIEYSNLSCSFVTNDVTYFALLLPVAVLYALAVFFLNNIVAKVKAGTLISDCLVIRLLRWLGRKIGASFRYVRGHLSLTAKGVGMYIFITIVEIILLIAVCAIVGSAFLVLPYLILKWLCIAGIVTYLIQTQELYKCAKEMAEGNLDRKADTRKMFWVFKAHGEHLNQISDGMAKAVDARMKSEHLKTELITNVSHDIKTPLTSIINYVDLLQKDNLDEATKQEYIAVLSRQSARLKKLIEDLVEASKASTGNIQINWAEIDANMLLEQAIGEYGDKLDKAGLKVVFTGSDTPAVVMADGQHLWRVFDNLLANISKYAMSGTRVYASVIRGDGEVRMEFKNISRDPLNVSSDELMERFVRGDSSRNTEGSGLGLSIANSLCTLMNARFTISIDGDLFKAAIIFTDNGTL